MGSVPSIKQECEEDSMVPLMPSHAARKRALMGEVRQRTTVLQQVQKFSPPNGRARVKREKKAQVVVSEDDGYAVDSVEPASTFKCPVQGCKAKPYRRNEHMKRHMKS
jgi:hypothetical protein